MCRCIPKYRVCLSDSSECPQHECIDRPAACDKNSVEPVCDTDGQVHPSLCHLQQSGKTLAYMGHCQVGSTGNRDCCFSLIDAFVFQTPHLCVNSSSYPSRCVPLSSVTDVPRPFEMLIKEQALNHYTMDLEVAFLLYIMFLRL